LKESNSFEDHWKKFSGERIPSSKVDVANKFLSPVFDQLQKQEALNILDAGCGNGVHVYALSSRKNKLRENCFIGIDTSMTALRHSEKQANEEWRFTQADIGNLPFKTRRFDIVFSYGVLAYTNNYISSFAELCRVTKEGGLIGVWFCPKNNEILNGLLRFTRTVCKIGGTSFTSLIANFIVPFLGFLPTNSNLKLRNASWKQCHEVVMVNLAPTNLIFLDETKVRRLFNENSIQIISDNKNLSITIWGRKN